MKATNEKAAKHNEKGAVHGIFFISVILAIHIGAHYYHQFTGIKAHHGPVFSTLHLIAIAALVTHVVKMSIRKYKRNAAARVATAMQASL